MSSNRTIRHGSCLCRAVSYRIAGEILSASHCHCRMCRKAHGAAFGTYAKVRRSDFTWLTGQVFIRSYQSSPDVTRVFCGRCGSTLQFLTDTHGDEVEITLGTLDDDQDVAASCHIYVDAKAPWYPILDQLPQHSAEEE